MKQPSAHSTLGRYRERGLGNRVGFGQSPAILVVDAIVGFTDVASPLGSRVDSELFGIRRLLDLGHELKLPIVFSTVVYESDMAEAGVFAAKVPSLKILQRHSKWVEVDPRLERQASDVLLEKKFASCFFGTHLASYLSFRRIDTLIVTGFTTSGCVRATVVDALQHGLRTIVPRECVGDRDSTQHEANLIDIEAKYGDVLGLEEVLNALKAAG